jgi:hypothetical protein
VSGTEGEPQLGLISDVIATTVLANIAFKRAASYPSGSSGRLAAAETCGALMHSSTIATARRKLEGISDPALRDAALVVLVELEQLVTEDAATSGTEGTAP